jgi:hypothetical protein
MKVGTVDRGFRALFVLGRLLKVDLWASKSVAADRVSVLPDFAGLVDRMAGADACFAVMLDRASRHTPIILMLITPMRIVIDTELGTRFLIKSRVFEVI